MRYTAGLGAVTQLISLQFSRNFVQFAGNDDKGGSCGFGGSKFRNLLRLKSKQEGLNEGISGGSQRK